MGDKAWHWWLPPLLVVVPFALGLLVRGWLDRRGLDESEQEA